VTESWRIKCVGYVIVWGMSCVYQADILLVEC